MLVSAPVKVILVIFLVAATAALFFGLVQLGLKLSKKLKDFFVYDVFPRLFPDELKYHLAEYRESLDKEMEALVRRSDACYARLEKYLVDVCKLTEGIDDGGLPVDDAPKD